MQPMMPQMPQAQTMMVQVPQGMQGGMPLQVQTPAGLSQNQATAGVSC